MRRLSGPSEALSQPSKTSQASSDAPETVGVLFDRWLTEHVRLHKAKRTYDTYEGIVRLHLRPGFGSIPLGDICAAHVQRYVNEMVADDAYTTTIARHRTALSSALRWAVRPMGWLDSVPMASVSSPRPQRGVRASNARSRPPEIDIPNADEVRQMLEANRKDPLWAMWFALYTLALRPSEVVALAEDKLVVGPSGRLETIAIHRKGFVSRERDERGVRPWVIEDPKWTSYRELEAPESTMRVLVGQAQRMRTARAGHRNWPGRWDGYLFRDEHGRLYDPTRVTGLFREACERAGVPVRPPVSARHYCASQLLEAGVPVKRVSSWLGHKTTQTVETTYAHVLRRVRGQEPTGAAMDRVLGDLGSGLGSD